MTHNNIYEFFVFYGPAVWDIIVDICSWLGPTIVAIGTSVYLHKDQKKINSEMQAAAASHAKHMISLQGDINHQQLVLSTSFTLEQDGYKYIWNKLYNVREAIIDLRPIVNTELHGDETLEGRRSTRLNIASTAGTEFIVAVETQRPFFDKEIYEKIQRLIEILKYEFHSVNYSPINSRGTYNPQDCISSSFSHKKIISLSDEICEMIRQRITVRPYDLDRHKDT